ARATATAASRVPPAPPAQHLDQLAHAGAAGELEEQLFQCRVAGAVLAAQIVDRAVRDDLAVLDDGDPVAHRLGDLEGVSAHQHRAPARDELSEGILPAASACAL